MGAEKWPRRLFTMDAETAEQQADDVKEAPPDTQPHYVEDPLI